MQLYYFPDNWYFPAVAQWYEQQQKHRELKLPDSCNPRILLEKLEADVNLYKSIKQKRKLNLKMH